MSDLLQKLNEVEALIQTKHQPGRHDQQSHAGERGVGSGRDVLAMTSQHARAVFGQIANAGDLGADLIDLEGVVRGRRNPVITKKGADAVNELLTAELVRQTALVGPSGYSRMKLTDLGKQAHAQSQ